jgi:hypothetical protein
MLVANALLHLPCLRNSNVVGSLSYTNSISLHMVCEIVPLDFEGRVRLAASNSLLIPLARHLGPPPSQQRLQGTYPMPSLTDSTPMDCTAKAGSMISDPTNELYITC